jgi:hypothetical protein
MRVVAILQILDGMVQSRSMPVQSAARRGTRDLVGLEAINP